MRVTTHTTTQLRLAGLPLWALRLAWLALVSAHLWLYWVSLRRYNISFYTGADGRITLGYYLVQMGLPADFNFLLNAGFEIAVVLVNLVFALLAFWRRSDDWLVLLFSFELISLSVMVTSNSTDSVGVIYPAVAWVQQLFRAISLSLTLWILYLLPDGRLVPRWSYLPALGWTAWVFFFVFTFGVPNDVALRNLDLILQSLAFGSGGAIQIYRYLRVSTPAQRQQGKWMLYGIVLVLLGFIASTIIHNIPGYNYPSQTAVILRILDPIVFMTPRLLLPFFLMFAVLRYRLWDVDFLINRSMVYGVLSLLLAGIFGLCLWAISILFKDMQGGPLLAVGISGVIFGAIFQPVRRRLRRFVDHTFYHIEIDYQRTSPFKQASAASSQRPTLSHTQLGEYKNLELIGRGGMAEIYKANHPDQGFPVAIKILRASLSVDEQFQRRFRREAHVIASLQHPNIVHLFDYGDENKTFYMVMEYLPGKDLGQVLKKRGRLPFPEAQGILQQVADALDYAHSKGLVHRDIKPSNIMLTDDGRAVLMDFGITKILGGQTALTHTGMLGTLDYIAPEQIRASDEVDVHADQYALGVLAYQLLTGELPFKKSNPGALLIAHLQQPPPDPRALVGNLPASTAHAIQRAMGKNPADRFETVAEFISHLQVAT